MTWKAFRVVPAAVLLGLALGILFPSTATAVIGDDMVPAGVTVLTTDL